MSGKWRWQTAQYAERKWWQNYLKHKNVQEYLVWKKMDEKFNGLAGLVEDINKGEKSKEYA